METYKKLGCFKILVLVGGKFKKVMEFETEAERDSFFEEFCIN